MNNTYTHLKSILKIARTIAEHTLMVTLCAWFALCTSIGPIFRMQNYEKSSIGKNVVFYSITDFQWQNWLILIISFACYYLILLITVHFGKTSHLPNCIIKSWNFVRKLISKYAHNLAKSSTKLPNYLLIPIKLSHYISVSAIKFARTAIINITSTRLRLIITLFIGWLWIPVTLLAAYGADICSQIREYSWAWNQVTGLKQPYIGFFSFVPADIYPTAHYLWPSQPTYLTDQHNIVLTVIYGSVTAVSRYFTDSNDAGIVILASLQFLFAIWCCAATAHRFLNQPWKSHTNTPVFIRFAVLVTFLLSPLVIFSTIALTKSPLFAFAFTWWFGTLYELRNKNYKWYTILELVISVCVMLIAAKYAWYILVIQFVILLISERKRWLIWVCCLLLPTIAIHGSIALLIHNGVIISGDPIESRGLQLQQIARIAKLDPESIPKEAQKELAPIFNIDQTAETYNPQDADPVKSSGMQSKKVSYRWRYVNKSDLNKFNHAWWLIVSHSPVVATDAFLAKTYGYFDITDKPYVGPEYYIYTDNIFNSTWIKYWMPDWRKDVYNTSSDISDSNEFGWLIHGNTYVIATLLIGIAELVCRRWKTFALHMPLALLVGVMMLAPANNFERHMLPVAFVFWFTALTFWRESLKTEEMPTIDKNGTNLNKIENTCSNKISNKTE